MHFRRPFTLISLVVAVVAGCGDGDDRPPVVAPGTDSNVPPSSEGPEDSREDGAAGSGDVGVVRGGSSGSGGVGFGGFGGTVGSGGFAGSFGGVGGTIGGTFGALGR
jgi:hypothetical protein